MKEKLIGIGVVFYDRCAQNTDSKASILRKAVDYILLLEDELRKYTDGYEGQEEGDGDSQQQYDDDHV